MHGRTSTSDFCTGNWSEGWSGARVVETNTVGTSGHVGSLKRLRRVCVCVQGVHRGLPQISVRLPVKFPSVHRRQGEKVVGHMWART